MMMKTKMRGVLKMETTGALGSRKIALAVAIAVQIPGNWQDDISEDEEIQEAAGDEEQSEKEFKRTKAAMHVQIMLETMSMNVTLARMLVEIARINITLFTDPH